MTRARLRVEPLEDRLNPDGDLIVIGGTPVVIPPTWWPGPAPASLIVTTSNDVVDPNDGVVSLREAITSANGPGTGTRNVTFDMTKVGAVIDLSSQLPVMTHDMNIVGPGRAALTVERSATAEDAFRLFEVGHDTTVTISGLTLLNGDAGGQDGGAIRSAGALTVTGCEIRGNHAFAGGGIAAVFDDTGSLPESLTISDTLINGNSATGQGGGVSSEGVDVRMSACVVGLNVASQGGGLYFNGRTVISPDPNQPPVPVLVEATLDQVEVTGNTAALTGGGVQAEVCRLLLTGPAAQATDIHDNVVTDSNGEGGGVYAQESQVLADHARIGNNVATEGNGMYLAESTRTDGTYPLEYYGGNTEASYQ